MFRFDTKTEEAFYNLMTKKEIECTKIQDKGQKAPDFLCMLNRYKAIFELKDFRQSGTTEWLSRNFLIQKITIANSVTRFMNLSKEKFLHPDFQNYPSGLVIFNLRPHIRWEDVLMPQIENALKNNLKNYLEIGNVIVAGYNEPSNQILALHIWENLSSNRIINRGFFGKFNHKYYSL